jgi:hypothetical protein
MEAESGSTTRAGAAKAGAAKKTRRRSSKASRRSKTARRSNGNGRSLLATPMDTAMREGTRFMEKAYRWADDMGRSVPKLARGLHMPSKASFNRIAETNPIVLGAVGLGIGVALGAMLPHLSNSNGRKGSRGGKRARRGARK